MLCLKCGMQGGDDTRFCRGCGTDVGGVLAVLDGAKDAGRTALAEKYIATYSAGIRAMSVGVGFLVLTALIYFRTPAQGILWLVALMLAFFAFASGISRFVRAIGIRKLSKGEDPLSLGPAKTEFEKPLRSVYDTDDLAPASVTERTTNLLDR